MKVRIEIKTTSLPHTAHFSLRLLWRRSVLTNCEQHEKWPEFADSTWFSYWNYGVSTHIVAASDFHYSVAHICAHLLEDLPSWIHGPVSAHLQHDRRLSTEPRRIIASVCLAPRSSTHQIQFPINSFCLILHSVSSQLELHNFNVFLCYGSLWGEIRLSRLLPWSHKAELCILEDQLIEYGYEDFSKDFERNHMNIRYIAADGYYYIESDTAGWSQTLSKPFVEIFIFTKDRKVSHSLCLPFIANQK